MSLIRFARVLLSQPGSRILRFTCLAFGSWDNAEQRLCHNNRLADKLFTRRIPYRVIFSLLVFETRFFSGPCFIFFPQYLWERQILPVAEPAKDAATGDLMPMGYARAMDL